MRFISYHIRKVNPDYPKIVPSSIGWNACAVRSLGELARLICKWNWSPGIFKHQYKTQANFISADFIALDFDSGDVTIEEARSIWEGCSHIIGTTDSHTPAKHKFRVVLTLEKQITKSEDYKATVQAISKQYGADTSVADSARGFFTCREIVSISTGDFQEIIKPKPRTYRTLKPQPGFVSTKIMALTTSTWVSGSRNLNCFILAKEMAKAGADSSEIFDMVQGVNIEGDFSEREMWKCIYSGIKSAKAEVENG
jgi:hypothetical protein